MAKLVLYISGQAPFADLWFQEIATYILESQLNSHADCELSLTFVDESDMAALNEKWRGHRCATDVLSLELERPGETQDGLCMLGDIIFCEDYIRQQAQTYGTEFEQELALLFIHGVLHLLGYDHMNEKEALQMEKIEDELLRHFFPAMPNITVVRHQEIGVL